MLIVPTVTPFKEESVDHDAVAPMLDFLADRGVRALFPLGTTGEFSSLSTEERRDTLTTFVAGASGRFEIIAHIGATTRREVIALGEHALGLGVRQAAVVTPFYFGYRQSDLEAFFREVSLALPDLQMYAYTIPSRAGNTLDIDTVARLAELPNVVGIKDSVATCGDFSRCSTCRASRCSRGRTHSRCPSCAPVGRAWCPASAQSSPKCSRNFSML